MTEQQTTTTTEATEPTAPNGTTARGRAGKPTGTKKAAARKSTATKKGAAKGKGKAETKAEPKSQRTRTDYVTTTSDVPKRAPKGAAVKSSKSRKPHAIVQHTSWVTKNGAGQERHAIKCACGWEYAGYGERYVKAHAKHEAAATALAKTA
ncbi:hypothetical protein [Nocardioides sp. KR10-350]|uniref:hypothetical protein n=1 Tax=Nocardioides cheoyonin TaxID=3156615 RepID=UPI0032B54B76